MTSGRLESLALRSMRAMQALIGTLVVGAATNALFGSPAAPILAALQSDWFLPLASRELPLLALWAWLELRERDACARAEFDLFKRAEDLEPADLGFERVRPGAARDLARRPYHDAYVPRRASPVNGEELRDTRPIYTEDDLLSVLHRGGSLVLIGEPTAGKSRTLFELTRRMSGWTVVRPTATGGLSDAAWRLLDGRRMVLLLDDLNHLAAASFDLRSFREKLARRAARHCVAAACRGGSELHSVRNATASSLRRFWEDLEVQLELLAPTAQERHELAAQLRGEADYDAEAFPTLGSICMEDALRFMAERFLSLEGNERDVLRAIQLLMVAGVIPLTHKRVRRVAEALGGRNVAHLGDVLDRLAREAFLKTPALDPVVPEPAYFRPTASVVTYFPGRTHRADLAALEGLLAADEDLEGLHSLGCALHAEFHDHAAALRCFRAVAAGATDSLGAWARMNEGILLDQMAMTAEAISTYERLVAQFGDQADFTVKQVVAKTLLAHGNALVELLRPSEAIALYDEVVSRFGGAPELALREQVARAMFSKGLAFQTQGCLEDAIVAYENLVARFEGSTEPSLREPVARAMLNHGTAHARLGRNSDASSTFAGLVDAFGEDPELDIREKVAHAQLNHGMTLAGLLGSPRRGIEVLERLIERLGEPREASLRIVLARALLERGEICREMGDHAREVESSERVVALFGAAPEAELQEMVLGAKQRLDRSSSGSGAS
jgi:tetratricopeptide (TPR) repeat protein